MYFLREVSDLLLRSFENSTTWCHAQHHIECSILWHICPFFFLSHHQHFALLVCELLFAFVAGLIVVLNACFLHGDFLIEFSGVLTLGPYCLLHTVVYIPLSTYGFVKY